MIFIKPACALSIGKVIFSVRSIALCVALTGAVAAPAQVAHEAQPTAVVGALPVPMAPVNVRDAWIRATVPGQSGTGAFMKLNSASGSRLVGVSTPVAGVAAVHEMQVDGDIMRMRAVTGGLALPAHQTVELKPGGYHVMLMDLKQPLVKGTTVPVTLRFEDIHGIRSTLELTLPVGAPVSGAAGNSPADNAVKH